MNSDGNLTFGEGDVATTARSLGRVLTGVPRVAPFFADLDPSAGGGMFVSAAPDAFTVTWCAVPDFDATGRVTAQASLLAGGAVEVRIDASTTLKDAVVALSPGAAGSFTPVDLSAVSGTADGGASAVGELFAAEASLDLVAASRRFYAEFADRYDQLILWTDTRVTESGTFAFESTVKNSIAGIGQEQVDFSAAYGSGGRLSSLVVMDDLGKYPADPEERANGENTTLSLVAHETGHRWGATLQFRDAEGGASDAWLGRQRAHWSFYCDSDASVLEGNDIEDQGGGSFRTVATVQRYSPFDLYAMGLLAEAEVPRAFYVAGPLGRQPGPRGGSPHRGHLHRHAARGLDRRRGGGDGPAQPARRELPARAPAGLGLRRGPRAHRRPRRDREAGDDPPRLRAVLLERDRRPHEPRDAARLRRKGGPR